MLHLILQSFKFILRNKALWALGFFTVFIDIFFVWHLLVDVILKELWSVQVGKGIIFNLMQNPLMTLTVLLIWLSIIFIIFGCLWLGFISQPAIIRSVEDINEQNKLNFRKSLNTGKKYLFPVVIINIIYSLIVYGLILVLMASLMPDISPSLIGVLNIVDILIIIILGINYFVMLSALNYITSHNYNIINSIKSGLSLFFRNWLLCFEIGLILLFFKFIAISLVSFVSFFIETIFLRLVYYLNLKNIVFDILFNIQLFINIGLAIIIIGIISAFELVFFTHIFQKLQTHSIPAITLTALNKWTKKTK